MLTRPKSVLMPGAFHEANSVFMRIYRKDNCHFYFLTEACLIDAHGNEYFDYREFHIGELQHKPYSSSAIFRMNELVNQAYAEVFAGEVNKAILQLFQDSSFEQLQKMHVHVDKASVVEFLKKLKRFNITLKLQDVVNEMEITSLESPANKFAIGLNQLTSGFCTETKMIDFTSCRKNNYLPVLGNGCLRAIAHALQSGSCRHLHGLTIWINYIISSHTSFEARRELALAAQSPNCPLGLTIRYEDGLPFYEEHTKSDEILKLYILYLWTQQNAVTADVLTVISNMTDIKWDKNVISPPSPLFARVYEANNIVNMEYKSVEALKNTLLKIIPGMVCKQLLKNEDAGVQACLDLSDKLQVIIRNEIQSGIHDFFARLSQAQRVILLNNIINLDSVSKEIAGELNLEVNNYYGALSGRNVNCTGLTEIFFSCIAIKKRELGKKLFCSYLFSESGAPGKILCHDELKGGDQGVVERKHRIADHLFRIVVKIATCEQLEIMINDPLYESHRDNLIATQKVNAISSLSARPC